MYLEQIMPMVNTMGENGEIRRLPQHDSPNKYGCYYCTNTATRWVWADADHKLRMAVCKKCQKNEISS